jgi:hypothetical protein
MMVCIFWKTSVRIPWILFLALDRNFLAS